MAHRHILATVQEVDTYTSSLRSRAPRRHASTNAARSRLAPRLQRPLRVVGMVVRADAARCQRPAAITPAGARAAAAFATSGGRPAGLTSRPALAVYGPKSSFGREMYN